MGLESKRVAAVALLLVSGVALARIEISTPLVAGQVATFAAAHETGRKALSDVQLQAMSQWLQVHKSGWRGILTPATDEPTVLVITLRDESGKSGSLAVVASARGGYYLQFVSASQKWSYRAFGGLFKSWAATHELPADDLRQLQLAVGVVHADGT